MIRSIVVIVVGRGILAAVAPVVPSRHLHGASKRVACKLCNLTARKVATIPGLVKAIRQCSAHVAPP